MLVLVIVGSGCGPSCADIARRMDAAADRSAPAPGTHIELTLPLAKLNPIVAELVSELEPRVQLPGVRLPLVPDLPGPVASIRSIRLVPFGDGKVGARVGIELSSLGVSWLLTDATVGVTAALRDREVQLRLNPADIVGARIRLPQSQLLAAIDKATGKLLKAVPRSRATKLVELIARNVELHGSRVIRDKLLRPLGDHELVTISLPGDIPIDGAEVFTTSKGHPHLRLALHTRLPGARPITEAPAAGQRPRLRLSAETAMAIANWGIANGHLPREFDRKLKPKPGGAYRPVFRWWRKHQNRPLKIHLYRLRNSCAYLRVGLNPALEVEGDEVVARFRDRTVEATDGPLALELGVAVANALNLSVDRSRRLAAAITVGSKGRRLALRVIRARRVGHDFELEVELAIASAPRAALEERSRLDQSGGDEVDEAANPCGLTQVAVQE